MNILVVNDDGIHASGLVHLAQMAVQLGQVTVVAPASQCSAMSQRITIFDAIQVCPHPDYPVSNLQAYSITGTPADCVKIGTFLMDQKPDLVLSGINRGYNTGFDIAYSGTVGACLEALMEGIPAIAFSNEDDSCYEIADHYLLSLTTSLLAQPIEKNALWNLNFPACPLSACKGILQNRIPAPMQLYHDRLIDIEPISSTRLLKQDGYRIGLEMVPDGTDIHAVLNNYISIGKIFSSLF